MLVRMAAMRIIYLSPHLDDAVLSAGGLMYDQARQGKRVEIWTIMAGLPGKQELSEFATRMHGEWGTTTPDATVRLRRLEDRQAAALVGARPLHFGFHDCIYRKDEAGTALYSEALYSPIQPSDASLPQRIAEELRRKLKADDRVVCQLGIGEHVDHLVVRAAAELLRRSLLYDADVPYVYSHPEELDSKVASMRASLEPVSVEGLEAWLDAIQSYKSQLSTLFESIESLRARIRLQWSEQGGIRVWSRVAPAQVPL